MLFETAIYIILAIYQLFKMISREDLAVDYMYFEFNEMPSSAATYIIIAIYQLFETTL